MITVEKLTVSTVNPADGPLVAYRFRPGAVVLLFPGSAPLFLASTAELLSCAYVLGFEAVGADSIPLWRVHSWAIHAFRDWGRYPLAASYCLA